MDEDYTVGDWVPAQVLLPSQEETSTVSEDQKSRMLEPVAVFILHIGDL